MLLSTNRSLYLVQKTAKDGPAGYMWRMFLALQGLLSGVRRQCGAAPAWCSVGMVRGAVVMSGARVALLLRRARRPLAWRSTCVVRGACVAQHLRGGSCVEQGSCAARRLRGAGLLCGAAPARSKAPAWRGACVAQGSSVEPLLRGARRLRGAAPLCGAGPLRRAFGPLRGFVCSAHVYIHIFIYTYKYTLVQCIVYIYRSINK